MEETISIRLKLFMDTNGLSSTQFADMCGIPRPSFSQLLSGRNKKVSDLVLTQIHKSFPDLSMNWLLFGEGPVRVSDSKKGGIVSPANGEPNSVDGEEASGSLISGVDAQISRAENSPVPPYGKNQNYFSKENALTSPQNGSNSSKNGGIDTEIKILDLQRQIENLRKNPRKVVQITIYYDDSTFETFVPNSDKDK